LVAIKNSQSHEKLLTYIQAKQKEGLAGWLFYLCIYVHEQEFGIQCALFSIIQGTTTFANVSFSSLV